MHTEQDAGEACAAGGGGDEEDELEHELAERVRVADAGDEAEDDGEHSGHGAQRERLRLDQHEVRKHQREHVLL